LCAGQVSLPAYFFVFYIEIGREFIYWLKPAGFFRHARLKSLDKRRKTLSELSKESGLSPPTVKEHLDCLRSAGLIKQKDEGHKWKYYELTLKGRSILHPGESRIWILLGLSAIGVVFFMNNIIQKLQGGMVFGAAQLAERAGKAGDLIQAPAGGTVQVEAAPQLFQFLLFNTLGAVALAAVAGICIGLLVWKRRGIL
jgi:DNA-binding transcriptional ArsR family regulator